MYVVSKEIAAKIVLKSHKNIIVITNFVSEYKRLTLLLKFESISKILSAIVS